MPGFQSSALVLLAQKHHFFRSENLDTTFEFFPTGKLCLDQVLQGKADFAVVFETPTMHAFLEGNKLAVLTELHRSEASSAIASRKDRGIRGAADLVGKKIAVVPKTNAEYLLGLYLRSHMIPQQKIKLQRLTVDETLEKLKAGKVDAAALWEPYLSQAVASNPGNLTLLQSPYYSEFSLLVSLRDTVEKEQSASYAVLRALQLAYDYYEHHREKAEREVDELLMQRGIFVSAEAWKRLDIHLGLSATLLAMLNAEASSFRSPGDRYVRVNLKEILHGRILEKVLPQTVTYE